MASFGEGTGGVWEEEHEHVGGDTVAQAAVAAAAPAAEAALVTKSVLAVEETTV